MDRFEDLSGEFDAAIIGGGIVGAGVARDAALRGLRVALFEKNDFGSGTTSGSTRLIHGGLRYLEMFDFGLVRMDLRERETLLRIAPHLVKPLEFLVPFYSRSLFYRAKLRAGMLLYDALSYDKTLPNHHFLNAADTLTAEPDLLPGGLQGSALYHDAQVRSPERLCLENIIEAREFGAVTLNYAEVTGAVSNDGRIHGLTVRDTLNGAETEVRAKVVVNASGPWFDRVAARIEAQPEQRVRTTKGIHIACEPVSRRAAVLSSKIDGRLFFVIPLLGFSWIGTTDTDFSGDPSTAHATPEDVEYLMQSASEFFPALRSKNIFWSNAGVRALVKEKGRESSVSRAHHVVDADGLISVIGGKITGYRAIAEEVTNLVCKRLGVTKPCQTADLPLPGARDTAPDLNTADDTLYYLRSLYGDRMRDVLQLAGTDARLLQRLAPQYPDIVAQVIFAVREEQCLTLADYMRRRSLLAFTPDEGIKAVAAVASWMAMELGWPPAEMAAQIDAYQSWVEETQAFRKTFPLTKLN
jgi:glycerol-3-phosphate dehydrogenase